MKKIIILLLLLVVTLFPELNGCGAPSSSTSISIIHPEEVLNQSVIVMGKVTAYQLNTVMAWTYTSFTGNATSVGNLTWTGNRSVNITDQIQHKTMIVDRNPTSGEYDRWTIEAYYNPEQTYLKVSASALQSNFFNVWYKSKTTSDEKSAEDQMGQLLDLMKTSTASTLAGSDSLDSTDCYVLNLTPSIEAIADLVTTQFQGYGGADYSTGPFLGGREDYLKFYNAGLFQVWIAKDSDLVIKAIVSPGFAATAQELGATSETMEYSGFDKVISSFQGQMNFSNYDQPTPIQVPAEGQNAVEQP